MKIVILKIFIIGVLFGILCVLIVGDNGGSNARLSTLRTSVLKLTYILYVVLKRKITIKNG